MVCLGNICRSPLAEGILQEKARQAGLNWTIESAGTNRYHTGEPPHRLSQKIALMNGFDISHQRARDFVPDDFERFDRIYAMARDVLSDMKQISGKAFDPRKADLILNLVQPGKNLNVPDPWYGGEEGYHEVYEILDEACDKMISKFGV